MNFYWIYDLPSWLLASTVMGAFVAFDLIGLLSFRKLIVTRLVPLAQNELVSYYLSAAISLYGITLGLIAVGTWETFSDADKIVSEEAASIAALYRDVSYYPEPHRTQLTSQLKHYNRAVIDVSWPEQKTGKVPEGDTHIISEFQRTLYTFVAKSQNESVIHAEAMRQFNRVVEFRRVRLQGVASGLPAILWFVILFGAAVSIGTTWFFQTDRFRVQLVMSVMLSALLGSLVFLIASLDNPYRGELSVGPDAFELVYRSLMK